MVMINPNYGRAAERNVVKSNGPVDVLPTQPPKQQKKFTPIRNLMCVELIEAPAILASGLTLPENAAGHFITPRAWVVAVGPDVKQCKEGDQVMIVGGTESMIAYFNGEKFTLIQETQCVGVVDEAFR